MVNVVVTVLCPLVALECRMIGPFIIVERALASLSLSPVLI
jgi:hypothetical protein